MAIGKFEDKEWKGTLMVVLIVFSCVNYHDFAIYFGLVKPLSISTAPAAADPTLNPAYGFWVRGNTSFFSPGMMNRTDTNESSPTFGYWTPPPEWRELCIESAGMPINACSYFQHELMPGFMTFFYITIYLCTLSLNVFKMYVVLMGYAQLSACLKHTQKAEGGLLALFTPWGLEKAPTITHMIFYKYILAITAATLCSGTSLCAYMTALQEPGFGLLNSMGTGSLYFGSQWNDYPLIDRQTLNDNYFGWHNLIWLAGAVPFLGVPIYSNVYGVLYIIWWTQGGSAFVGPVGSSFLANQVVSDVICDVAWLKNVLNIGFMTIEMQRARAESCKTVTKAAHGRIFGYPPDPFSWESWKEFAKTEPILQPSFLGPIAIIVSMFVLPVMAENNITDPAYLANGDQGMLGWLKFTHISMIWLMVGIPLTTACLEIWSFGGIKQSIRKSKHLMSPDMFKKRIGVITRAEKTNLVIMGAMFFFYTLLMPGGMAMQVYGIQEPSRWPSPLNVMLPKNSETNMMAAPMHFLFCKVFFCFTFFFCDVCPKYRNLSGSV